MKIVVLDGIVENPGDLSWEGLEELGELIVYDRTEPNEIIERLQGAEVAVTNKVVFDKKIIDACPDLKMITLLATGYNIIDTEYARDKGICVCNVPAYSTDAVAQHVFALLLEITNHVGRYAFGIRDGEWQRRNIWCYWDFPLMDLKGMTLGIMGYGNIGQAVANIGRAFGMNVIAWNHRPKYGAEYSFDEVLAKSDVISLHCPLNDETREMINKDSIAKMKDGVIIINTARGPLINEVDLRAAIESGKVYFAGMDVVYKEPIEDNSPIIDSEKCIITPHVAWASYGARARLMDETVNNVKMYMQGTPVNVVN